MATDPRLLVAQRSAPVLDRLVAIAGEAQRMQQQADETTFNQALNIAFDNRSASASWQVNVKFSR